MKLNIGGQQTLGRFPEGWTCVDILPGADIHCDIAESPLPFSDATVDAIYCSHVLEHIWPWRLEFTLNEFQRVLAPGKSIRIVVPDMDIAIHKIIERKNDPYALDQWLNWWFDPSLDKDGNLCYNHVTGFNYMKLSEVLRVTGFRGIKRRGYGDHRGSFKDCDNPGHEKTSLYVEAIK